MKLVPLKNMTQGRLVFPDLRDMNFEVGETKRVPPAMLSHPSIARRLGKGKELSTPENTDKHIPKVTEPKAPDSTPAMPPEKKAKPVEPIADLKKAPVLEEEPKGEPAGDPLREAFLAGPGITESNVSAIMDEFPSIKDLSGTSREKLLNLGVSKFFVKKLLEWATK